MIALPFAAIATSATIAPRIEVYTMLACNVYRPEYVSADSVAKQLAPPYLGHYSFFFTPGISTGTFSEQPFFLTNPGLWGNQTCTSVTAALDAPYETGGVSQRCASDPEVQAAVAELTAGELYEFFIISDITCSQLPLNVTLTASFSDDRDDGHYLMHYDCLVGFRTCYPSLSHLFYAS